MHPLGALDDHAYVLEDAAIGALIFDAEKYGPRAAELRERLPDLRLLSLGPTDVPGVVDLTAEATTYQPALLTPPQVDPEDVSSLSYTGGSTGQPKGVMSTYRSGLSMTQIQMAEWQWPDRLVHLICTPLSHAGGAFFDPGAAARRLVRGAADVRPRPRGWRRSRRTGSRARCSCRR